MANTCSCRRCISESDPNAPKAANLFLKLGLNCPDCGDPHCPSMDDHRNACQKAAGVGNQAKAA